MQARRRECLPDCLLQRSRIACNAERCNTYSNSVCPSVCPSVTRWYPIQTNEDRITRSSLWGSKNTLVFWYQQWLGGDVRFHLKFALKMTYPPLTCADFDQYLLITFQPWELAKNVQLSRIGSRPRAFQRAIDEVRTLPLSPQRVAQKVNLSFLWIKINLNRIISATKFLCVKTSSGKIVEGPFPYLMVYICRG